MCGGRGGEGTQCIPLYTAWRPLGGVGMQVCVVFTIIVGFMFVLYKWMHVVTDRADFRFWAAFPWMVYKIPNCVYRVCWETSLTL